eukprot:442599_1
MQKPWQLELDKQIMGILRQPDSNEENKTLLQSSNSIDSSNFDDSLIIEHLTILKESISISKRLILLTMVIGYCYNGNAAIFVLYAKTIYDNTAVISILIYAATIFEAILTCMLSILCDKYGFDNFLLLILLFHIIGTLIIALANYNDNFITLSLGYLIAEQPISRLITGYIQRVLPMYYSKYYMAAMIQLKQMSILIGTILAGIITYYTNNNYQTVYFISFSILLFAFIHRVYLVWIKKWNQNKIENKQLTFLHKYSQYPIRSNIQNIGNNNMNDEYRWQSSNKYRFPICLISMNNDNNDNNVNSNNIKTDVDSIDWYKWWVLTVFGIQYGIVGGIQLVILYWYALYMRDRYNVSIVISTLQIGCEYFFLIIGIGLINQIQSKNIITFTKTNNIILFIMFLSYVICIFLLLYCFPTSNNNNNNNVATINYWFYNALYGLFCGILLFIQQIIIINNQSIHQIGRTAGMQEIFKEAMRSMIVLVIGLLWNVNIQWMWYTQAIAFGLALILLVAFVVINTLRVYISNDN